MISFIHCLLSDSDTRYEMETETSETLKKQFQLLQEQQQKKLQRRKQKKEEKNKEKEKSIVNTSNAFGIDDDLNLKACPILRYF